MVKSCQAPLFFYVKWYNLLYENTPFKKILRVYRHLFARP